MDIAQQHGKAATQDHAAGPGGVNAVEPPWLVMAEGRRDQRVGRRFDGTVTKGHYEGAGVERPVSTGEEKDGEAD